MHATKTMCTRPHIKFVILIGVAASRLAPPNNLNILADFQNRYVLLKKGLRFVTLIREAASQQNLDG